MSRGQIPWQEDTARPRVARSRRPCTNATKELCEAVARQSGSRAASKRSRSGCRRRVARARKCRRSDPAALASSDRAHSTRRGMKFEVPRRSIRASRGAISFHSCHLARLSRAALCLPGGRHCDGAHSDDRRSAEMAEDLGSLLFAAVGFESRSSGEDPKTRWVAGERCRGKSRVNLLVHPAVPAAKGH